MGKTYIGISIGPIFETINLATSPASLWAASYMFSTLSKIICQTLIKKGVREEDIITPYYNWADELINRNDGVGLFHDRIIFKGENFDIQNFNEVRHEALSEISEIFRIDYEYLDEYIMISAVCYEAENPVSEGDMLLDSAELLTPYVFKEYKNPIISLFTNDVSMTGRGSKAGRNEAIKRLIEDFCEFQLKKPDGTLKSIEDIVKTGEGSEKYKYYAIVRADGDGMRSMVRSLKDDSQIRRFSKNCLMYCAKIADVIKCYDGVTIYSGGDDLLAILPCESRSGDTILNFIKDANDTFKSAFLDYYENPSLSFGITIAYYKYPLYEAVSDSSKMLFNLAKNEKNGACIHIIRNSGQVQCLFVSNTAINELISLKDWLILQKTADENGNSFATRLMFFGTCFENAKDADTINNLFENIFLAESKENEEGEGSVLSKFFYKLQNGLNIKTVDEQGIRNDKKVIAMCYIIKLISLFRGREDHGR